MDRDVDSVEWMLHPETGLNDHRPVSYKKPKYYMLSTVTREGRSQKIEAPQEVR